MSDVKQWLGGMMLAAGLVVGTSPLVGCDDGNDVGDAIEDAGDNTQDALDDAADNTGDALDDAGDNIEDAAN